MRELTSGIFFAGSNFVDVSQQDDVVRILISPEKNSATTLHVNLSQPASTNLKYIIQVDFHHEHASLEMRGLYQLRDQEILDIQTVMNHYVPHCASEQLWKGVLRDTSSVLLDTKIIVHPNAQKTSAKLSNKNLLLSTDAQVQTKPILEIYADDVKCSHGATVGCLDHEALFYLRSRGIAENLAREMLVDAFCVGVVEVAEGRQRNKHEIQNEYYAQ